MLTVRKAVGRIRRRLGATPARMRHPLRPIAVWLAYGATLWFWHASGPYELAVHNTAVHIGEHLAFLIAALAFSSMVLRSRRSGGPSRGYRVLMVFTTAFHGVLLADLITFARSPWYSVYERTSASWGLDPLADQQLAGLIMWIPGGLLYTAVGLALIVPLGAGARDGRCRCCVSMSSRRRAMLRSESARCGRRARRQRP